MTEEELVQIVKAFVVDSIEPLQLQITSQKGIIENLQTELETVTEQHKASVDVIDSHDQLNKDLSDANDSLTAKIETGFDNINKNIEQHNLQIELLGTTNDDILGKIKQIKSDQLDAHIKMHEDIENHYITFDEKLAEAMKQATEDGYHMAMDDINIKFEDLVKLHNVNLQTVDDLVNRQNDFESDTKKLLDTIYNNFKDEILKSTGVNFKEMKQVAEDGYHMAMDDINVKFDDSNEQIMLELSNQIEQIKSAVQDDVETINNRLLTTNNNLLKNIETNEDIIKSRFATMNIKLDDDVERIMLQINNTINKELLRLNDYVSSKLTTLKGEKGDPGEKGDQGENGFLSGVSKWETGKIIKEREAVTYDNGIWLCSVEQTACKPGENDDYVLIQDGVKSMELEQGRLIIHKTSGINVDLGRVTMVHRGVYDPEITYDKYDIVTIDKTSFLSKFGDNKSRPPSNGWDLLSGRGARGTKGDKGADANMDDMNAVISDMIIQHIGENSGLPKFE